LKRGGPRHPKTRKLARELNIPIAHAVGILEMLWHFTGEFCPRGDIGRMDDETILESFGELPENSRILQKLIECGFIDRSDEHRLIIHDWGEHCDDYTKKKLKIQGFACVQKIPENSRLFSPALPCLAMPSHAEPSLANTRVTDSENSGNEDSLIRGAAERLYAAHPKKTDLVLVPDALVKAVNGTANLHADLDAIEACHAAWCKTSEWKDRNGRFAPKLAMWLTDKGFTKWPEPQQEPYDWRKKALE
jgi:hypothetical protein